MLSGSTIILALILAASAIGLSSRKFIERTVLRPYQIAHGSAYQTLLTSGFVHADLMHLLFNLFTFYSFAAPLERTIGTPQFVMLYCCGLLISGVGTVVKHRNEPNYASLGASGAVLAVLFASIVYFPSQRILILPIPLPIPAPLFALAYLAYSYYSSGRNTARAAQPEPDAPGADSPPARTVGSGRRDNINHDAHIFGALTGVVFVLLTNPEQFQALLHAFF